MKDVTDDHEAAAALEEMGMEDAAAGETQTVPDIPGDDPASNDVPKPLTVHFKGDKENNRVQHGDFHTRSSASQGMFSRYLPSNQPNLSNTHLISASNHYVQVWDDDKPMAKSVPLTIMIATQRVTKLFPSNAPTPAVKPELPAVVCTPDNELAILCFDAGKTIKVIKGQRAREEVVVYLFSDLLGIEVLPAEVLRLGENVRKAAVAAKDGESVLKNGASAKKSRLK